MSWKACFPDPTRIVDFFKFIYDSFFFWCAVGLFTLLEPLLTSHTPTFALITAQVVVLFINAFLFLLELVGDLAYNWDDMLTMDQSDRHILVKIYKYFSRDGKYLLSFVCLLNGFIFIWRRPGVAALRCFRVFRILWFYEIKGFRKFIRRATSKFWKPRFISRCFNVMRFAVYALRALGNEMFRLTVKTRGGLLLMLLFFYCAFVFGNALWLETGDVSDKCSSTGHCMYTMMRLTFFDGVGFDYAYSLLKDHKYLFILVMVYMCVTSFGILNGLTGVFGLAINNASNRVFQEDNGEFAEMDAEEEKEHEADRRKQRLIEAKEAQRSAKTHMQLSPNSRPPTPGTAAPSPSHTPHHNTPAKVMLNIPSENEMKEHDAEQDEAKEREQSEATQLAIEAALHSATPPNAMKRSHSKHHRAHHHHFNHHTDSDADMFRPTRGAGGGGGKVDHIAQEKLHNMESKVDQLTKWIDALLLLHETSQDTHHALLLSSILAEGKRRSLNSDGLPMMNLPYPPDRVSPMNNDKLDHNPPKKVTFAENNAEAPIPVIEIPAEEPVLTEQTEKDDNVIEDVKNPELQMENVEKSSEGIETVE